MQQFPVIKDATDLVADDFVRFRKSFSDIVRSHLPVAAHVTFIAETSKLSEMFTDRRICATMTGQIETLLTGDSTHCIGPDHLLLSIGCLDSARVVIHIGVLDGAFVSRVADDWLLQTAREIRSHLLLLKQARTDQTTGLLNLTNLEYLLNTVKSNDRVKIVLVKISPIRVPREKIFSHTQKVVSSLAHFFHDRSTLHHLGHSIFANIVPEYGYGKGDLESSLVSYLKREGFRSVHIGSASGPDTSPNTNAIRDQISQSLLDKAWSALIHATHRGPYSYCDYQSLGAPQGHPLAAPSPGVARTLRALTRKLSEFSVVICERRHILPEKMTLLSKAVAVDDDEFRYFILPSANQHTALSFSHELKKLWCDCEPGMAIGVAVYPSGSCSRKDAIYNCKKAFRHAQLLGTGEPVMLDALSYNVSGDIYFAEGDMVAAVREYRKGLQLAPEDVNLNNSLGVTLAFMDKGVEAMNSFRSALTVEPDNFMALYNLGLAELGRTKLEIALALLEQAAKKVVDEEESAAVADDLYLRVGRLAVELGEYQKGLDYLQKISDASSGSAHYPAGLACYGLGDNKMAMVNLQRALQVDRFNGSAMALLGKIYFEEQQGADIALSLCEKSIQLEPENDSIHLYYAELLAGCGRGAEARNVVRKLLRKKSVREKAQFAMAKTYRISGDYKNALKWLEKIKKRPARSMISKSFQQQVRAERKLAVHLQKSNG